LLFGSSYVGAAEFSFIFAVWLPSTLRLSRGSR
jgi:hypothetical protein